MKFLIIISFLFVDRAYSMMDRVAYDVAIAKAKRGDIAIAQNKIEQILVDQFDNPELLYDAGVLAAANNQLQESYAYFSKASNNESVSEKIKEKALYNAANIKVTLQELENAIALYEQVLALNENNIYAQHNLERARELLEQQKQQEQKDNNNQDQNNDTQNSDDQKNDCGCDNPDKKKDQSEKDKNSNQENESNEQNKNDKGDDSQNNGSDKKDLSENETDESDQNDKSSSNNSDQLDQKKDAHQEQQDKGKDSKTQDKTQRDNQEKQREQNNQQRNEQQGKENDFEDKSQQEKNGQNINENQHNDTTKKDTLPQDINTEQKEQGKSFAQIAQEKKQDINDPWLTYVLQRQEDDDKDVNKQLMELKLQALPRKIMIKTIGKFFLSFVLFNLFVEAEDIKLSVQDVHGAATSQVFVGKPFTLEVEVAGFSNNIPEPTLKNVGDYSIQRTGMYMSTINGYSTKKYSYLVRIDTPGKYHLGPAVIDINGNRYESEEILLSVEQFLHGADTVKNVKKQEAFAYLTIDKDSVVVGEKIKSTLTFYTNNPDVRITDVSPGIATTVEYENIHGPEVGLESINGVEYHFARWTWDAHATVSGELVLPACSLQYVIPSRRDYRLGGFGSILGLGNETKKTYSNPQSIIVEPIEKYAQAVDAVGIFNHFGATITPGVCKAGEGMLLTVTLNGDGNWNRIPEFTLQNIPKNLRYYSSETSFTQDDALGIKTKKMEFIIQPSEPGDFIIPSQKFTFFDIESKTNKTLSTAQLDITILPNDAISTVEIDPQLPKILNKEDSIEPKSDLIALLYLFQDIKKSTPTPIAWWMFLICVIFPVLLFFSTCPFLKNAIQSNIFYRYIRNKRLFYKARKDVLYAQEHARADLLYNLFVKLICNYYLVAYVNFDQLQPNIEKLLDKTINNGKNWKGFFSYITELAFTKKTTVKDSVYEETLFWINRLEKEL